MARPDNVKRRNKKIVISLAYVLLSPVQIHSFATVNVLLPKISIIVAPQVGRDSSSQKYLFSGGNDSTVMAETETEVYPDQELRIGIEKRVIEDLQNGAKLPYDFQYYDSCNTPKSIRIKQLEKQDVNKAVSLCLKEYGSYPTNNLLKNQDQLSKFLQGIMNDFDNFLFSFVVLLGLGQRVERREKSDIDPNYPQDHNVICIYEVEKDMNEIMFGMAEISLQPADPSRTSPPFVIPTSVKNALVSFGLWPKPSPYISNVLVTNKNRGKGYSKVLMACCEGMAKQWGYEEAYLHVDADWRSGAPAQGLYRSLGYTPVIDEKYNQKFAWMGMDTINRGLYIVDGVALLFLKKKLKETE